MFSSDNVVVVNNTSWRNGAHPEINGELIVNQASNVRVFNNIIAARSGEKANEAYGVNSVIFENNIVFGGVNFDPLGGGGNKTADPLLANPDRADFGLRAGSPAIDSGLSQGAPAADIRGVKRPQGRGVDIGALEALQP